MGYLTHIDGVVSRTDDPRPCVVITLPDYPYDCIARDKRPGDTIRQCETHRVWWPENPETGEKR
jgi:hypothetical protein